MSVAFSARTSTAYYFLQKTTLQYRVSLNTSSARKRISLSSSSVASPSSRFASTSLGSSILPIERTGGAPKWCQPGLRRHRDRHLHRHRRWNTSQSSSTTTSTNTASSTNKYITQQQQQQQQKLVPTSEQLRILAFRSGIPMIGFGIMDNVVMITAGEAIDSTFGVYLGISTMAAAGFGQCISDVAGLTSGGLVDAAVSKLNIRHHGLSPKQLDLKIARMYSLFGACVGVLTGCLLGMTVLLFMDTDRADRKKRAKELKSIFESVMDDGHNLVEAERATLFMVDEDSKELWSQVATGGNGKLIIKVPLSEGIVGWSVSTGKVVNVPNAYENDHFDKSIDASTGFKTESVLVVPIKSKSSSSNDGSGSSNDDENSSSTTATNNKIIGAIQMINKQGKDDDGTIIPFTENDEKIVTVLASHVATFIQVVDS